MQTKDEKGQEKSEESNGAVLACMRSARPSILNQVGETQEEKSYGKIIPATVETLGTWENFYWKFQLRTR